MSDVSKLNDRELRHHLVPILPVVYGDSLSYMEDLSKLVKKINETIDTINDQSEMIVAICKEYTDGQIESLHETVLREIDTRIAGFYAEISRLEAEISNFESRTNTQLGIFRSEFNIFRAEITQTINDFKTSVNAQIQAQNLRIEQTVAENQAYTNTQIGNLRSEVIARAQELINGLTVENMFTGERVSIQEMFNYLGSLHVDGAITITQITTLQRTVNTVVSYDETCTNYILNGYNIFNEI